MKFYYFTVMIVGIILVLNLGGITTPTVEAGTGVAKALNLIDDDRNLTIQNVKSSELWSNEEILSDSNPLPGLKFIMIIAIIGGIAIGIFGRSPDIRYLTAAWVFVVASLLLSDMVFIFLTVTSFEDWIAKPLGIIIGGLIAGYVITVIQFWQGTD